MSIRSSFSQRSAFAAQQAISFLMQQGIENPDCLSLAAGFVDPRSLPIELARIAADAVLGNAETARPALQYGTTQGLESLRHQLLQHLARMEKTQVSQLGVNQERLFVTTGSQQLLALLADALFDPGDICLIAAPTYFVFLGVLDGVGARTIPIHTDQQGMSPEHLEQTLAQLDQQGQLSRVKLIYVVSSFENPSGITLSADRRPRIVDIARKWSRKHKIYVLEDAAYRELRYSGSDLPSLFSFDTSHETVILAHTFSKSFSPGIRVGFGVVPQELHKPLSDLKGNQDFGSPNLCQYLLHHVLASGEYPAHVKRVCDSYRSKRDALVAAADRFLAPLSGVEYARPEGGLYLWLTLPSQIPTGFDSPLFQAATRKHGVIYVPGEICFGGPVDSRPRNHIRLSFGVLDEPALAEAIRRLSLAIGYVLDS